MLDVPRWRHARGLGESASLHWMAPVFSAILFFIAALVLYRAKKRDWYEGPLEETKGGLLPEPKPSKERVYSLEE